MSGILPVAWGKAQVNSSDANVHQQTKLSLFQITAYRVFGAYSWNIAGILLMKPSGTNFNDI